MPTGAKRPCSRPGCGQLVESGYCPAHASVDFRASSTARLYDGAWRRFRLWFLSTPAHRICEDCGRRPANEVHHVIKLTARPDLRLVESNCRGLCKRCHNVRTGRGE